MLTRVMYVGIGDLGKIYELFQKFPGFIKNSRFPI